MTTETLSLKTMEQQFNESAGTLTLGEWLKTGEYVRSIDPNYLTVEKEASPEEKIFLCEGDYFTLSQMLHANSSADTLPIDEDFVRALIEMEVGGVFQLDLHAPDVERVR